jgi:hypothetical protein
MRYHKIALPVFLVSVLALGACRSAPPEEAPTGLPAATTQASEAPTPTPQVTVLFATAEPTAIATPVPEAVDEPAATESPPEPTAAPQGAGDQAQFVADVTVPDGSNFSPGAEFVKTWRLRNSGSSTWTAGYALVFVRGAQMAGPAAVPLESPVLPGEAVDLSINMTAPQETGSYVGFWMLRNGAGILFGIGPEANQPVYVQINVTPAGAGEPGSAPTGAAGAIRVTGATLSVDRDNVAGACPQTFQFSGTLVSEGAGSITYRLEAEAENPAFAFNLPPPNTSTFTGPGPRSFGVSYAMAFSGSVTGEVWLQVVAPNEVLSNRVPFSLTCQAGVP